MAVMVTGCAGFIGSHLCEALLAEGQRVIGIDCISDYYNPSIKRQHLDLFHDHSHFEFIEGDLSSLSLTTYLETVDCVFHAAAQPGVRGSWGESFRLYTENNIQATQRLLEAIKQTGKSIRVVYSSSSSIYGNPSQLPTPESALPQPYSPYGTTKLAGEHLCMLYFANYKIPTVSLRYFTVYGPRQRPDMAFHLFFQAIQENHPIRILGDGCQTRDFTFVQDIVQANLLAAQKPVEGEVVNIGGGSRRPLREVLTLMESVVGRPIEIEYSDASKGDVKDTWADTTKLQALLDFQPAINLEEGLKRQWEWHQLKRAK